MYTFLSIHGLWLPPSVGDVPDGNWLPPVVGVLPGGATGSKSTSIAAAAALAPGAGVEPRVQPAGCLEVDAAVGVPAGLLIEGGFFAPVGFFEPGCWMEARFAIWCIDDGARAVREGPTGRAEFPQVATLSLRADGPM